MPLFKRRPAPPRGAASWGWRFGASSRVRFRRQTLLLQGLLAAAPWLNVILVCGLLLFAGSHFLVQRGTRFDLPASALDEGSLLMMPTALLMPLDDAATEKGALLFYDDLRYHAGHPDELARFTEALRQAVEMEGRRELILLADERVPHEWVMAVAHAARKSGLRRINVAARAASGNP